MEEEYKKIMIQQMQAALSTLGYCINACPEKEWHAAHQDYPFSQVVFHCLFFTDYYLERGEKSFKNQIFHRENRDFFKDYEELEHRLPQNLYARPKCLEYLRFCVDKCSKVIARDNGESLTGGSGFPGRQFSRAQLYIYTIRHIQHHAAQLGLRLQPIIGREMPWVGSGWSGIWV